MKLENELKIAEERLQSLKTRLAEASSKKEQLEGKQRDAIAAAAKRLAEDPAAKTTVQATAKLAAADEEVRVLRLAIEQQAARCAELRTELAKEQTSAFDAEYASLVADVIKATTDLCLAIKKIAPHQERRRQSGVDPANYSPIVRHPAAGWLKLPTPETVQQAIGGFLGQQSLSFPHLEKQIQDAADKLGVDVQPRFETKRDTAIDKLRAVRERVSAK